jgi:hypothetical protein
MWSHESPGYALDDQMFDFLHTKGLFYHTSRLAPTPTLQLLINGYMGALSPGLTPTGYKDDNSLISSFRVKNEWSYASKPPTCLHSMDRDNTASSIYKCQVVFVQ